MNTVFVVGVFVLPRLLSSRWASAVKLAALVLGVVVFLYTNYGETLTVLPSPSMVLGPVATFTLEERTTTRLMRLVNSLLLGPVLVSTFGVVMNHVLTRPELVDIPFFRHALPRRDPDRVVVTSAGLGTAFYLLVVAAATGHLVLVP
jgi:hypothetical protein